MFNLNLPIDWPAIIRPSFTFTQKKNNQNPSLTQAAAASAQKSISIHNRTVSKPIRTERIKNWFSNKNMIAGTVLAVGTAALCRRLWKHYQQQQAATHFQEGSLLDKANNASNQDNLKELKTEIDKLVKNWENDPLVACTKDGTIFHSGDRNFSAYDEFSTKFHQSEKKIHQDNTRLLPNMEKTSKKFPFHSPYDFNPINKTMNILEKAPISCELSVNRKNFLNADFVQETLEKCKGLSLDSQWELIQQSINFLSKRELEPFIRNLAAADYQTLNHFWNSHAHLIEKIPDSMRQEFLVAFTTQFIDNPRHSFQTWTEKEILFLKEILNKISNEEQRKQVFFDINIIFHSSLQNHINEATKADTLKQIEHILDKTIEAWSPFEKNNPLQHNEQYSNYELLKRKFDTIEKKYIENSIRLYTKMNEIRKKWPHQDKETEEKLSSFQRIWKIIEKHSFDVSLKENENSHSKHPYKEILQECKGLSFESQWQLILEAINTNSCDLEMQSTFFRHNEAADRLTLVEKAIDTLPDSSTKDEMYNTTYWLKYNSLEKVLTPFEISLFLYKWRKTVQNLPYSKDRELRKTDLTLTLGFRNAYSIVEVILVVGILLKVLSSLLPDDVVDDPIMALM